MNEEKLNHLNMLEQSLQQVMAQRQQMQAHLLEIDSALEEVKDNKETFRLVGNILVKKDHKKLNSELESEKESLQQKLKTTEEQEKQIKQRTEKLRTELMNDVTENDE
jgi:prefoldin beta subunit